MRARVTLVFASLAFVSVAIACSEAYGPSLDAADAGQPPGDSGAPETSGDLDGSNDAASDANDASADATVLSVCPRPPGPKSALAACEQRPLYVPANTAPKEFPFAIATDSAFVYWVAMRAESPGDVPYDGVGTSRVMRVDRRGAAAASVATIVADGQRDATSLVTAGDWIYWGASNGGAAELRRAPRDCASNCAVTPLATFVGPRIGRLAAIDAQTLVVQQSDGRTSFVKVVGSSVVANVAATTSDNAGLTTTTTAGFVTGFSSPAITQISATTGGSSQLTSLPEAGAGQNPGLSTLTTDCSRLYGWRSGERMWTVAIDGGATTDFAVPGWGAVFDLATDQTWLYAALPNGGGVFAIARNGKTSAILIRAGNVHRLAVDDVGLYWGDHDNSASGTLWMMVK